MSAAEDRDPIAWHVLSGAELAEVATFGIERATVAGELLFEAGEASYDLFVVLAGTVEVVRLEDPDADALATYGSGGFVGEMNLLSGQRRSLSCRVTEAGRVLVIAETEFRRLMSVSPALAETIFNALIARREILRSGDGAQAIRIVGSRYSSEAMSLRSFAEHSHLAHAWIDLEDAEDVDTLLASLGLSQRDIPAVITATETLCRASAARFAEHLGLTYRDIHSRHIRRRRCPPRLDEARCRSRRRGIERRAIRARAVGDGEIYLGAGRVALRVLATRISQSRSTRLPAAQSTMALDPWIVVRSSRMRTGTSCCPVNSKISSRFPLRLSGTFLKPPTTFTE